MNSISDNWNDNLQSLNQEKMKHQYQSFTQIGRQFQSLKRQVCVVCTSVSFPLCQRSCLIWRIMTNTMTNTYVKLMSCCCWLHFLAEVIIPDIRISSSLAIPKDAIFSNSKSTGYSLQVLSIALPHYHLKIVFLIKILMFDNGQKFLM